MGAGVGLGTGSGIVTREGRGLFKVEGTGGCTESEVVIVRDPGAGVDVVITGIFEDRPDAGEVSPDGTVQAGDEVTGALASPATELSKGFGEMELCKLKTLEESSLAEAGG